MVHSCDQKLCREAFETEWQTCVHWSLGLQKYANCETVLAYKNISSVGLGPFVIFVQFPHCLTMKLSNLKHWQHHDRPTHQPTCSAGVWLRSKATKVDKVASFQDRRVTMLCSCWFYIVYYKIVSWCLQFCPFLFGPAKLVLVKTSYVSNRLQNVCYFLGPIQFKVSKASWQWVVGQKDLELFKSSLPFQTLRRGPKIKLASSWIPPLWPPMLAGNQGEDTAVYSAVGSQGRSSLWGWHWVFFGGVNLLG